MASKLDQIIVIDVEATCWEDQPPDKEESEIIEIGLCVVDIQRWERTGRERILVKPSCSQVSQFCTQLTGFTQAQVETGRSLEEACQYLRQRYQTRPAACLSRSSSAHRRKPSRSSRAAPHSRGFPECPSSVRWDGPCCERAGNRLPGPAGDNGAQSRPYAA